jgi:competence protein ComEA
MRNPLWAIALSVVTTLGSTGALAAPPQRPAEGAPAHPARPAPAAAASEPQASIGVVNLNEASAEQLELLPGVGPSRATAIVSYRKLHPFKHVEELQKIKGIGKKTFARLRPLLALSGPTTLSGRPSRN